MIVLKNPNASVQIDSGELVSYLSNEHEFMHQKENPGWRNVDTEMFPIIGPTAEANFQVQTPRDMAVQDQHGLLREMDYKLLNSTDTKAVFQKKYQANTRIKNSKYPNKSTKEFVSWPYDFVFTKSFELQDDGLAINFKIDAPRDTPFMLGYHPAFQLHASSPVVIADESEVTLATVLAAGSRAYEVANCSVITLKDKRELRIETEGFGHFMLWTEVPNMICIEPITFYPYAVSARNLHEGFRYTKDVPIEFKVRLSPS